jgi:Family of unknown function (DUF6152)
MSGQGKQQLESLSVPVFSINLLRRRESHNSLRSLVTRRANNFILLLPVEVSEMKYQSMKSTGLHAFAALLIAALPVAAHHSFTAEYDPAAMVTLKGVVKKLEWSNPHAHIYVDVKDDSGKITTWDMEGGPPHFLQRNNGVTQNFVNVGDTITITGFRARDNSRRASRCEVTTVDGKKYNFGGAGEFKQIPR